MKTVHKHINKILLEKKKAALLSGSNKLAFEISSDYVTINVLDDSYQVIIEDEDLEEVINIEYTGVDKLFADLKELYLGE